MKYVSVKFDGSNRLYTFECEGFEIKIDDYVVVDTQYGLELASAVKLSDETDLAQGTLIKPIVRMATSDDIKANIKNKEDAKKALAICQKEADELHLDMNVISTEYTLDRAKLTFVYVADDRVDFRELLKILAAIFKCRIELRQVGARDKAKLIGGIGTCGRELCCKSFKSDFDMVSINMAKNQLLALNISKLSGHCGKLMCCLKYEDDTYKELRKDLPKLNSQVEYEGAMYRIGSMNVIARTCKLENKDNVIFITLDELIKKAKYKAKDNASSKELSK